MAAEPATQRVQTRLVMLAVRAMMLPSQAAAHATTWLHRAIMAEKLAASATLLCPV